MTPRIYIDTSVIGGYFDEEFEEATRALFRRLEAGEVRFVVSDLLELELLAAPTRVRNLLGQMAKPQLERLTLTQEAADLADRYLLEKVVG